MNLYLITQSVNNDYDTYDSAVVAAESEEKAKTIHPAGYKDWDGKAADYGSWCGIEHVEVELIGVATGSIESGVMCASFNAG